MMAVNDSAVVSTMVVDDSMMKPGTRMRVVENLAMASGMGVLWLGCGQGKRSETLAIERERDKNLN